MDLAAQVVSCSSVSDGVFQLQGSFHMVFASDGSFVGMKSDMVRYDAEYVGWMPDYLIAVTRLTKVA
jgi:hypothetical protein